jgi:hypothetical protein
VDEAGQSPCGRLFVLDRIGHWPTAAVDSAMTLLLKFMVRSLNTAVLLATAHIAGLPELAFGVGLRVFGVGLQTTAVNIFP